MVVRIVQQFFAPLTLALRNRGAAMTLIEDLGWTLDEQFDLEALAILDPVATELNQLTEVVLAVEAGTREPGEVVEEIADLLDAIFVAVEGLQDLAASDVSNLAAPMNTAAFWREFALDLPEYLILTYLETYLPLVFALVDLGGAIGTEQRPGGRPARRVIDWDALGAFLRDPSNHLQTTYVWGGALEHALLMPRLRNLLWALNLPGAMARVPGPIVAARFAGNAAAAGDVRALAVPVLAAAVSRSGTTASGQVDGMLVPVPRTGTQPSGLLLTLQAFGEVEQVLDLGGGWNLTSGAALDASGVLGIEVQPTGITLPSAMPNGSLSLALVAAPADPLLLAGTDGSTRVQLRRFEAGANVEVTGGAPSFGLDMDLQGLELVVMPGDGDGFLSDVLGELEFTIPMELGVQWSQAEGLRISGGAGLDVIIPINRTIGPLSIESVALRFIAGSDGAELTATTTGGLEIGPFAAVVRDIGFRITLEPVARGDRNGKGAVVVRAAFKPPSGLGLSVNAPGVGGGGYLEMFPEIGRYNGMVNLRLLGLEITAIGLIATQMPDGSEGWSMFLSISVQFGAGIQLAFGFKLTGIGGLAGVHRGIDIEALGDGVRTGALNAVLFPDDPVANAPAIISALDTIFPIQRNQYVFGPVFQLGWGVGDLVTIQLGLVIQLPSPLTVSLLGSIAVRVAKDDLVVISIIVDVAGTLWPTEGKLAIDSSIREGKIAFLNLSGDMSVRADFGARKPTFLVANGGFHPHFTPPEGFPTLNRLALRIFDEDNLRLGVEAYLAVTSNTMQFGVAAFFYAEALGFVAEGRFEFDTLIIFKPFGLTASLGFTVQVRAGRVDILSITLRGTLKGPQPWMITGYAEFKVLGVTQEFEVQMTIGQALSNPPREVADLFDGMLAALRGADAWAAGPLDPEIQALVSVDLPETGVFVHPAGRIKVTQPLAPLNLRLEKFGEETLRDAETLLVLDNPRLDGEIAASEAMLDWFSPAQYFDMAEEDKLTAPSFEELEAGLLIGEMFAALEPADPFEMSYETRYVDPDGDTEYPWGAAMRDGVEAERERARQDAAAAVFSFSGVKVRATLSEVRRSGPAFAVNAAAQTVVTGGAGTAAVQATWSAARAAPGQGVRPAYELSLEQRP